MLYLAEVKKKSRNLLGIVKTELLLFACQRDSQTWHILPEPQTITIKEAYNFSEGTLVTINIISEQKIIGKVEIAKPYIIKILRDFNNMLEKFQKQQQEVEEWKQSLAYQFEELEQQKNQFQLQQMQQDLQNYSSQSQQNQSIVGEIKEIISSRKLLGEILQEADLVSDAQLQLALMIQADYPELKIGQILALRGWINLETVDFFAQYWSTLQQQQQNHPLGFYLQQAAILSEEQINILLDEQKKLNLKLGSIAVLKGWLKKKTLNFFLENFFPEHQSSTLVIDLPENNLI
ncbi:hypothetical protein STA3757_47410 [Stanieria sp. NIES-3757]|nr:hypothetical protein STA3757_47410 [Stanieria sp. NIES-3757]